MAWCVLRGGKRLWYEERGKGPPLVLLHGWCMSSAVWRFQFEALGNVFRLIAPDLRGHGQSDQAADGHGFPGFAEDITDLFQYLDLWEAFLAGWSLGAQVALLACELLRKRLSGLILISATSRFTAVADYPHGLEMSELDGMGVRVRRNPARAFERFRADMFAPGECDDPVLADRIHRLLGGVPLPDKQIAVQGLRALAEGDMRGLLSGIDTPTLIINGDRDRICLPAASSYLATRIKNSVHVPFGGCGHAPFLTRNDEFNEAITGFYWRILEQGR